VRKRSPENKEGEGVTSEKLSNLPKTRFRNPEKGGDWDLTCPIRKSVKKKKTVMKRKNVKGRQMGKE